MPQSAWDCYDKWSTKQVKVKSPKTIQEPIIIKSVCLVLSSHVEVSKIFEGEGENVLLTTKKKNIMAKDHHNIMIIKHSLYFFLKPYMELGAKQP